MFLNKKDLAELVGAKIKRRQIEWLTDNGFRFTINAAGCPMVLISEVESKLLTPGARKRRHEPNFDEVL
jgi:hypothetical protein